MLKIMMKLMFLLFLGIHTQAQSIIGTWQVDAEKTFKNLSEEQIEELQKYSSLENFKKDFESKKFAFYPNQELAIEMKSLFLSNQTFIQKTQWRFSEDKQKIMATDRFGNIDTLEILKLRKQKLILLKNDDLGKYKIFFYPSKTQIDTNKRDTPMPEKVETIEEEYISPAVSREVLADIIKSIPSPIEISFLIKDLGVAYNQSLLAGIQNSNLSDFQNAWNMGVYSTDLFYTNLYAQKIEGLSYLQAIQATAQNLEIDTLLDLKTIQQLVNNQNNLDSLLMISLMNLEDISEHLQEKGRADLTIVMLTGGWLEALYLSCKIYQSKPNALLKNRIGEQGIILDQLLLLLSFYEDNSQDIKNLIDDLHKLKQIYDDKVRVEYTYTDTSTPEETENGILIGGNAGTHSEITFTDDVLNNILQTTTNIRNKMLK